MSELETLLEELKEETKETAVLGGPMYLDPVTMIKLIAVIQVFLSKSPHKQPCECAGCFVHRENLKDCENIVKGQE